MTEQRGGTEVGYTWPGLPVICMICLQGGVPTYQVGDDRCGFVMPQHDMPVAGPCSRGLWQPCPGSGSPVQKPVHATMAARIEAHVLDAMPPAHVNPDDIPEASHLTELDPMKGPGN